MPILRASRATRAMRGPICQRRTAGASGQPPAAMRRRRVLPPERWVTACFARYDDASGERRQRRASRRWSRSLGDAAYAADGARDFTAAMGMPASRLGIASRADGIFDAAKAGRQSRMPMPTMPCHIRGGELDDDIDGHAAAAASGRLLRATFRARLRADDIDHNIISAISIHAASRRAFP